MSSYIEFQKYLNEVVVQNHAIARMFARIADILDILGELPFKVNAYRRASRVLDDLQDDIEALWQEERLRELPGIGDALVKKIDEFLRTGTMKKYEEVSQKIPEALLDLLDVQSLGPKTIGLVFKKLNVQNLADLMRVIDDGSMAQLPGMGQKKIENLRKGIDLYQTAKGRISIGEAIPLVDGLIDELQRQMPVAQLSYAGSTRRMKETVGDIDILVATDEAPQVIDKFIHLPQVERILGAGGTKASILVSNGLQVDLRAVPPESYGAALQYFTGSQAHNIKLRGLAKKQGLRINEYGVFRDEMNIASETEDDIYRSLNLPWIAPELREDRGEIEVAQEGKLPSLIELKDIQGDLHVHSTYSDGHASIDSLAQFAQQLGYRYLALCDHSRSVHYAQGLSAEKLLQQIEEIEQLNKKLIDFKILKGSEVDILADGSLDFSDELLAKLDIVIASIHTGFKQNVTERIIAALENPYVDIIAHPTGRLLSRREGYVVDVNAIFEKAAATGKALEINAYPDRLDLSDLNARKAVEMGVKLVINTDAHQLEQLRYMKFGVGTARRGWVTKKDVLNTMSSAELMRWRTIRK